MAPTYGKRLTIGDTRTHRANRDTVAYTRGLQNLPSEAIEKLINVREAAGYLWRGARCQACGYLHENQMTCPSGDRPPATGYFSESSINGAGKLH